eukprot:scaffold4173_cov117-Isochrysis_galbana.AAC.1
MYNGKITQNDATRRDNANAKRKRNTVCACVCAQGGSPAAAQATARTPIIAGVPFIHRHREPLHRACGAGSTSWVQDMEAQRSAQRPSRPQHLFFRPRLRVEERRVGHVLQGSLRAHLYCILQLAPELRTSRMSAAEGGWIRPYFLFSACFSSSERYATLADPGTAIGRGIAAAAGAFALAAASSGFGEADEASIGPSDPHAGL